jgi:hypothetical protein
MPEPAETVEREAKRLYSGHRCRKPVRRLIIPCLAPTEGVQNRYMTRHAYRAILSVPFPVRRQYRLTLRKQDDER